MAGPCLADVAMIILSLLSCHWLSCDGELGDTTLGSTILDEILAQTVPPPDAVVDSQAAGMLSVPIGKSPSEHLDEYQLDDLSAIQSSPSSLTTPENSAARRVPSLLRSAGSSRSAQKGQANSTDTENHNQQGPVAYFISNPSSQPLLKDTVTSDDETLTVSPQPQLPKLYIGGLFELNGSAITRNGRSELEAAQLAVDHINEQQFIPGYHLEMFFNDTKVRISPHQL